MLTTHDYTVEVAQKLKQLPNLPVPVMRWKVDIGEDATGEMAAWVWAVVDDANLNRDVRNRLREWIDTEVRRIVPNLAWVYVRFRAVSED